MHLSCVGGPLNASAQPCPLRFVLILSNQPQSLCCTLGTAINALSLLGGLIFGSRPPAPAQLTISKRPPCVCLLLSLQTSRAGVCITERYQWPRPLSTVSIWPRYCLPASLGFRNTQCKKGIGNNHLHRIDVKMCFLFI